VTNIFNTSVVKDCSLFSATFSNIFYGVLQAQQLFQKDSNIITPEALATVKAAIANSEKDKKVEVTKKAVPRKAAGQSWEDPTLADWPESKISNSLLSTCLIHNVSEILNFVVYGIFNLAM